jgi:two-component system LytT family sensor kinase
LALQTLIENSVKHNVVSKAKPLQVVIKGEQDFIVVSNNLQLRRTTAEVSSHSGLTNINERYKLLVGKEIGIQRTSDEFIVKLPVLVWI